MASKRACVLLRAGSHYRSDAFRAGLERHGCAVTDKYDRNPRPNDVLILWNRRRSHEPIAQIYEAAGARVIVTENGYIEHPGARKGFALALDQHNGAGRWRVGDKPRFAVPETPWRREGLHVLVLPQRGIGARGVAMPPRWRSDIEKRIRGMTSRPIIVRNHPGASPPRIPLEQHFRDAHCVVTWGSGAALKALQAGVPVFHDFPRWIGSAASCKLDKRIEDCMTESRDELWRRLSWAQWSLDEISTGEALDGLLNDQDRDLFRAE